MMNQNLARYTWFPIFSHTYICIGKLCWTQETKQPWYLYFFIFKVLSSEVTIIKSESSDDDMIQVSTNLGKRKKTKVCEYIYIYIYYITSQPVKFIYKISNKLKLIRKKINLLRFGAQPLPQKLISRGREKY